MIVPKGCEVKIFIKKYYQIGDNFHFWLNIVPTLNDYYNKYLLIFTASIWCWDIRVIEGIQSM